jgi:hypothetical protein
MMRVEMVKVSGAGDGEMKNSAELCRAYGAFAGTRAIANLRDFCGCGHAPIWWAKSTMLEETTSKFSGFALSGTLTGPLPYSSGRWMKPVRRRCCGRPANRRCGCAHHHFFGLQVEIIVS